MKRLVLGIVAVVGLLAALAIATYSVPALLVQDEPVAAGVEGLVEDARRTVIGQSRVFPLPLHPQLIDARCFSDETVVLYFEEWVPPYLGNRYAVAIGSPDHDRGAYTWEGGYHLDDIGPDSAIATELAGQLGEEIVCPG